METFAITIGAFAFTFIVVLIKVCLCSCSSTLSTRYLYAYSVSCCFQSCLLFFHGISSNVFRSTRTMKGDSDK